MAAYFKSEALKARHSFLKKLVFLAPVFTIVAVLFLSRAYFHQNVYNWWYVMILPGMISVVCTLVAGQDGKMKNMAVMSLPVDLKKCGCPRYFCACLLWWKLQLLFWPVL